jgi:hypothetical protein
LASDVIEIIVGDGSGANDRAEYLLADNLHVGFGVGQHSRLHKVAAIVGPLRSPAFSGASAVAATACLEHSDPIKEIASFRAVAKT